MTPYVRKKKDAPWNSQHEPDWSAMLTALRRKGYPLTQLAERCLTTRDTLYAVQKGLTRPSWIAGEYLRRLHNEIH